MQGALKESSIWSNLRIIYIIVFGSSFRCVSVTPLLSPLSSHTFLICLPTLSDCSYFFSPFSLPLQSMVRIAVLLLILHCVCLCVCKCANGTDILFFLSPLSLSFWTEKDWPIRLFFFSIILWFFLSCRLFFCLILILIEINPIK